ncbi:MAG: preprotein translocase subunit SecE [Coriobacteriales bacterium]|jgi:preprotein translocase subunit SecE|nr:preprotein translocase subunit SecE [Coriobacteriales bacterium]
MAHKKKRKANRPRPAANPAASEKNSQAPRLESEDAEIGEGSASQLQKPAKDSVKDSNKDSNKAKEKGKEKAVVNKSQARARDPKKAAKKPNIFRRAIEYFKQVRLEIKRTTWPTGNEVLNMTIIVIVALLFFGVFIFVIDLIMVELIKLYSALVPDASVVDPSLVDTGAVDTGAVDTGAADLDAADVTDGAGETEVPVGEADAETPSTDSDADRSNGGE